MQSVETGVPSGSVLGPLLFTGYLLPLELIPVELNVNYHFYADDTFLYFVYNVTQSFRFNIRCKNGLMEQNFD